MKTPPVEPPASALRTMLRAPCTLVPGTHGASAVKMHITVPTTTTTEVMLMEQAADNAAADNSHNKGAKRRAISWRLSIVPWSKKTFPNCPEVPPKSPTCLLWSKMRKNNSSLMNRLPVQLQQNLSLLSPFRPLLLHLTQPVDLLRCIIPGPHNGVLHPCHRHKQHSCRSTHSGDTASHRRNIRCHARKHPSRLWHQCKKAPPVAAPQPSPRDETPAPPETGNGEYLLPIFHFSPFGTATAVQETHHLDLFSFHDSFLEQSLDPYGISIGSMMFPSMALLQPIDAPIPSYPTIMTRSCVSSGSAPTCVSTKEELKWPEASWLTPDWTGECGEVRMSRNGSTSYTRPVGITALMSSTPPQPCKRSKSTILRLTMTKPTFGTISKRMISVTPRSTSWTLLELGERNMFVDCFTSTTRNIPGCQPGNATTNSSIKHGPKRARTLSCRVSFHLKTQESIGTKSTQPSITSVKKQRTCSDSDPSAKHPKKSSTSTTCSRSTFQTDFPAPNQTKRGPTPMTELPGGQLMACSPTRKQSPMTPKSQQLPGMAPLTECELQDLCASVLTETFPEVCITDAVIPDPCEHMELDPTALQWRDPTSKTFLPSTQLVPISLATVHQFSGISSPTPLVVLFDCSSQLSFLKRSKVPKECEIATIEQPVRGLTGTSHLTEEVTLTGITLPEFSTSK